MKNAGFVAAALTGATLLLAGVAVGPAAAAQSVPGTVVASPASTPALLAASTSRDNAKQMALDFLDYSAFSRIGLIKQLQFEGFSRADATYGANATRANWFKQAARMAASYLDYQPFSRVGLISQLKYEGFTAAQAAYGAKAVGL